MNSSPQLSANSDRDRPVGRGRWLAPLIIALGFAGMTFWSWRTWPDVLVDFGQQLYIAWQLSTGKILYTDIAYYHGALSPYLNAFWFRLFGTSLLTLALCNLAILAAMLVLLFRILTAIASRTAAMLACLTLVFVFGFGQQVAYGNYNFICPYEHGVTHGIALSFLAIYSLWRFQRTGRSRWVVVTGLVLGLVFLTKSEVFLAAAAAVAAGWCGAMWSRRASSGGAPALSAVLLGFAILPPLAVFLLFCRVMTPAEAGMAALGPWPSVLAGKAVQTRLHLIGMGLDAPGEKLRLAALWLGWYAIVIISLGALALYFRRPGPIQLVSVLVVFCVALLIAASRNVFWSDAVRVLPVMLSAACVILFIRLARSDRDSAESPRLVLQLMIAVFALALLAKIILNARTYHYGFALAMPATLLLVVILTDWIPAFLSRRGGYPSVFMAGVIALWVVGVAEHLRLTHYWFNQRTITVAGGNDAFRADSRGEAVNAILAAIHQQVGEVQTVTVIPDGAMLNYLSRRRSSVPYLYLDPIGLSVYGEPQVRETLRRHPPDFIVLVHKSDVEHGYRYFGVGYAEEIAGWIRRNYERVALAGAPPLETDQFGIALLRRRSGLPAD